MKLQEVLEKAEVLYPSSVVSSEMKTAWVSRVDGRVSAEILKETDFTAYDYPQDAESALLIPFPYDDVYDHYVCAMSAYMGKDYATYQNAMQMFNTAWRDYVKNYIQNRTESDDTQISNIW